MAIGFMDMDEIGRYFSRRKARFLIVQSFATIISAAFMVTPARMCPLQNTVLVLAAEFCEATDLDPY